MVATDKCSAEGCVWMGWEGATVAPPWWIMEELLITISEDCQPQVEGCRMSTHHGVTLSLLCALRYVIKGHGCVTVESYLQYTGKTPSYLPEMSRPLVVIRVGGSHSTSSQHHSGRFLSGGPGGALPPPLNFDNPKRSKSVYVTCGTIIRRVVVAARCKSSVIDFWIF